MSCEESLNRMFGALKLIPHFNIADIVNISFGVNEGLYLPYIEVLLLGINNLLGQYLEGLSPDGLRLSTPTQNLRGIVSCPKGQDTELDVRVLIQQDACLVCIIS